VCVSGWTLYAVDGSFPGCTGYGRLSDSFLRYFTAYLDTLAWPLALSNMRWICLSLTCGGQGGLIYNAALDPFGFRLRVHYLSTGS